MDAHEKAARDTQHCLDFNPWRMCDHRHCKRAAKILRAEAARIMLEVNAVYHVAGLDPHHVGMVAVRHLAAELLKLNERDD